MRRIVALAFALGANTAIAAPEGSPPAVVPGVASAASVNATTLPVAGNSVPPQGPSAADLVKQAKEDLRKARSLAAKKDFVMARPLFEAAYAVIPDATLLFELVHCQRELGAHARALQLLFRAQAWGVPKLAPRDEKALSKHIAELTQVTSRLSLASAGTGVKLSVDAVETELPPAGVPLVLEPGPHTVRLEKPAFEVYEKEVTAVAGLQDELKVEYQPWVTTGHLKVLEKSGQPLEVIVDGKSVGQAPWEGDLLPGPHSVEGRGPRVSAAASNVELTRRAVLEVGLDTVVHSERVVIEAPTTGAKATLDGRTIVLPFDGYVQLGTRKLEVTAPGFEPEVRNLEVVADKPLKLSIPLQAAATEADKAPDKESEFKIGALLGIISVPRPINVELSVKPIKLIGFGVGYSMLPELTASKVKFGMQAFNGVARVFPFQGSFYLGAGVSYQMLRLQAEDTIGGQTLVANVKHDGVLITPQIGWLIMWDSGFTLGINLGVQIPLSGTPKVTLNNPDASQSQTQAEADAEAKLVDNVKSAAKYLGKIPLPAIDLIKIGFFF